MQVYLHLKPGKVEGLPGGAYYYNPVEHKLALISPGAEIPPEVHSPFVNRPVFEGAALSLFLVAQLGAIVPLYGERSLHYAAIEAGLMTQLLETAAPACGLGLCQIGEMDFERVRGLFALEPGHVLVHSLVGGSVDTARETGWSPSEEEPLHWSRPPETARRW
nr:hypothetical protein [uncultured bacterium]